MVDAAAPRCTRIAIADQRLMPWRNGQGSTREVAIDPPGATAADPFRWRISRATVAADGPFSRFPGIDRSLWLARGAGIVLVVDGQELRLDAAWQRADFGGERTVHGRLLDGPIEDLNVMVDRAQAAATSTVLLLAPGATHSTRIVGAGTAVVVALTDALLVHGHALAIGDALRLDIEAPLELALCAMAGPCAVLVAAFAPRH